MSAHADLEPVELGRIVAARHHDAAPRLQVADGEIQDRRGAGADVDDVDARGQEAFLDAGREGGGAQAAVPAEAHRPDAVFRGVGADGAAELHDEIGLKVLLDPSPDVVFPEDGTVHQRLQNLGVHVYHRLPVQTIQASKKRAERVLGGRRGKGTEKKY